MTRFAIIGAGIAGLSCADRLVAAGHAVRLYDKGRGPGGRMSTRRVAFQETELRFDHGAQYFTARDPAFREQVDSWVKSGVAAPWPVAGKDAFVGTPAMNAPVKEMSGNHDVRFAARIDALDYDCDQWRLIGQLAENEEPFDGVIVAIPAEQASALIGAHAPGIADAADRTTSDPCWTVMANFDAPLPLPDTLRPNDGGPIGWAARNNAKAMRAREECWVIQAGPEWSRQHLEQHADTILKSLLEALRHHAQADLSEPVYSTAHRWRFARSGAAGGPFWDAERQIGACGDWTIGPRVEDAWLSGQRLADMILG